MFYFFKMPNILQKLFPHYLWRGPSHEKVIYLTFDDGPSPEITKWTLETLRQYKAKATFFCLGNEIEINGSIVNEILSEGHQIGNHSYSHFNGWKTKTSVYLEDIERAQKVLDKIITSESKSLLFRPPYGKIKPNQAIALRRKGYRIVMFEIISGDFDKKLAPEKSLQKVLKHTKSGSIVVFHDSENASKTLKDVLPKALKYWQLKGYRFEAIY